MATIEISGYWEIVCNASAPAKFELESLKLVEFLTNDERCILGEEMLERAESIRPVLGRLDAEHILESAGKNGFRFPEVYGKLTWLFPGFQVQGRHGNLKILYLERQNGVLVPGFRNLIEQFGNRCRIASLC